MLRLSNMEPPLKHPTQMIDPVRLQNLCRLFM